MEINRQLQAPAALLLGQNPYTHRAVGWVDTTASMDLLDRRKSRALAEVTFSTGTMTVSLLQAGVDAVLETVRLDKRIMIIVSAFMVTFTRLLVSPLSIKLYLFSVFQNELNLQ